MNLRYKIEYVYDYANNSVVIIISSPWLQKEYPCNNINNAPAVLGHALVDFNELHQYKIEELKNEEIIEEAKSKKSGGKEFKGKQAESNSR